MPSSTISQNLNPSSIVSAQGPGAAGEVGKHVPIPLGDSVTDLGKCALSSSCPGMGSKICQKPRLSQSLDTSATGIGDVIGNQANGHISELEIEVIANAIPANRIQAAVQVAASAVANQPPGVAVANRLADNFVTIAEDFTDADWMCNALTRGFERQIEGLNTVLGGLDFNNLSDGRKSAAMRGLNTLVGFIRRYDTTALGGVDRGGLTLLERTAAENNALTTLFKQEKNLEAIKSIKKQIADLKTQPESEENKKQIADLENDLKFLEANKQALAKEVENLDPEELRKGAIKLLSVLGELTNPDPDTRDPQEKIMNVLQQVSFGAWLCNDVIPAFEGSGLNGSNPLESLVEDGTRLAEFKKLNEAARGTPMFSEVRLPETLAGKFPQYASSKFGPRGRSGCDAAGVPNTERQPLYNLTEEEKAKGGSVPLLKDKEGVNTKALETGFVPKPTARRDALPKDVVDHINSHHKKGDKEGWDTDCDKWVGQMVKKGLLIEEGGTFKSASSYAAIIDDAGFSTYCSVSGTTGELVCSLRVMPVIGSFVEETLNGIMEVAKDSKKIEGKDFSQFFAPIAAFMEVGHFHTTAEVLGGLFSVACANDPKFQKLSDAEKREFMETGFKTLLNALKDHPECFLGQN